MKLILEFGCDEGAWFKRKILIGIPRDVAEATDCDLWLTLSCLYRFRPSQSNLERIATK